MPDLLSAKPVSGKDEKNTGLSDSPVLFCFCHLRWNFVFQRPQHLMSRAARSMPVFVMEEPVFPENLTEPFLENRSEGNNLHILVPHFVPGMPAEEINRSLRKMLDDFIRQNHLVQIIAWYYTPMALAFSHHLKPVLTVYDCMDELSAFRGADPELLAFEERLFDKADVVFTGGQSLFEAKRQRHPNVYAFPSSIDKEHFMQARQSLPDPADQVNIPHPRMGFYGVLDERFDIELLDELARRRPEWHFVMLGPVVKIAPESLPQHPNVHYLGMKSYQELPAYLGNWDVALLLFAMNESTRFISPTKTPEYLAALKPVVSTPITDVVNPYEEMGLVKIGRNADEFEAAIAAALMESENPFWQEKVENFLATTSWDQTWERMWYLMEKANK
jgi:glycosyltransferase involved in cell wall biosynthesis